MPSKRQHTRGRTGVIILLVLLLLAVGLTTYWILRAPRAPQAQTEQLWTCPMHPSVIRPEPGQCPICGMDLVLMEEDEEEHEGIEGHGAVTIEPDKQQLIGVVTTTVARRPLEREVRTVGQVMIDETRLSEVTTKVEGWIERLYADETGKTVSKGSPLLTIYSPELVSAQEEYLIALRSKERLSESPFEEVQKSGERMLEAARTRLRLWDISAAEIAQLESSGEVRKTLTIFSPTQGYIMEKHALQGMRVMPAMTLYKVADLSRVWVEADIYEYESSQIKEGQKARLSATALPGQIFEGRVDYIYPTVDMKTRTLRARLEFANPGLALKPNMYADVVIMVPAEEALALPEEAVLDTGTRKVVFIKEGEGTFLPREVTLGARAAGWYPVLSGLQEGDEVVSSPNFLIDSESRFAAVMQESKSGGNAAGGHQH